MKNWTRILLFNFAFFGVLVLVLELVFGDWFHEPNRVGRLNLVRDCHKQYDASYLYDGGEGITYTRDEWGLRGKYPSLDDIDIVTLGGSATDQRYVTDGKTWQDVIAREFVAEGRPVSVVNAGVDGQSTYGHIKDFDWWFPTLPHFKPRYVLFYVSGNDIYKSADSDFDDLVNHRPPTWKTHVKERSAMYHIAGTALGVYEARHVHKISHRKEPFGSWDWTSQPLVQDHAALVAQRLDIYRKAVALLAQKARAIGATPIFVTQSLSVYRFRADGTVEGRARGELYDNTLINGVDLYYIIREFWQATMDECAKSGGVCIDAGNEMRWQPGDFYDVIHNTPQGSERLGKYLHEKLRDLPIGTAHQASN
jgi:hypothetical protein